MIDKTQSLVEVLKYSGMSKFEEAQARAQVRAGIIDSSVSAEVIPFPSVKTDVLDTLMDMLANGEISEFVIFAPNAKDSSLHHFTTTDGITLTNLLMAKHLIHKLADKFD